MTSETMICPRCTTEQVFSEHECGDDTYDSYSVHVFTCNTCSLAYNSFHDRWSEDFENCNNYEDVDWYSLGDL